MAKYDIVDLTGGPLAKMTPAELHGEGLGYLNMARQEYEKAPNAAAAASIALGHFFASMSADSLGTEVGSHRTDEEGPLRDRVRGG